jgi:hypothetical protein
MKETKNIVEESVKIPSDMIIDVLAIIVKEGLKHEVLEVMENRKTIILGVTYDKNSPKHQKIMENIQNQLADYECYRWSENEQINWREN